MSHFIRPIFLVKCERKRLKYLLFFQFSEKFPCTLGSSYNLYKKNCQQKNSYGFYFLLFSGYRRFNLPLGRIETTKSLW